jgi:hypothetical protein
VIENASRYKTPEEILLLNIKLRHFLHTLEFLRAARKCVPSNTAICVNDRNLKG